MRGLRRIKRRISLDEDWRILATGAAFLAFAVGYAVLEWIW